MATTSDLKKGLRIQIDGDPYTVLEVTSQSPSARGAATLVKTKLRNIRSGQLLQKSFKSGERIILPDFEIRPVQYLYHENGEHYHFMDQSSYEQFSMGREEIETELGYIRENDEVRVLLHDGKPIGLEIPNTVILEVVDCDPALKGDTVTAVTKTAVMETGLEIQVPLFVEKGAKLVVDTREARYVRRA